MSESRPVCAACHYPLGGWSSPRCPECGTDCQRGDVRTGPATIRPARNALIAVVLLAVAPMLFGAMSHLFSVSSRHASVHAVPAGPVPRWGVTIDVMERGRRWQTRPDRTFTVQLAPVTGQSGAAARALIRQASTDDTTDATFRAELDAAIETVVGVSPSSDAHTATRDAILAMLSRAEALAPPLRLSEIDSIVSGTNYQVGGGGSGAGQSGGGLLALAAWAVVIIPLLLLTAPVARRIGSAGTRAPRDGEWLHAGMNPAE